MAKAKSKAKPGAGKDPPGKKLVLKKSEKPAVHICEPLAVYVAAEKLGRRLRTRDSDEMSERSVKLKLGMFPGQQIKFNLDDNNMGVHEKVKEEVRRCRKMKKHMQQEFWQKIIAEHRLTGGVADGLRQPTNEEVVSKELDGGLRMAHASNPAAKSSAKLINWMKYNNGCNSTEFFGLCKGCFESPSLGKSASRTLLGHLLTFVARTRADKMHTENWEILKSHFDEQLASDWHAAQSGQTSRAQFLRAHREALQLFLSMAEATAVETAIQDGQDPDLSLVEKLCKGSCVGAELFAAESFKIEMKQYVCDIIKRLHELDNCNYEQTEVQSFRRVCMALAETLDVEVWRQFDGCDLTVQYLGGKCIAPKAHPNDQWSVRLEARARTLAVSTGSVERTPWEKHLYGETGGLPELPETVTIPQELRYDMANGREFLMKVLGEGWNSVAEMKRLVKLNGEELRRLDKNWWLDEFFLYNQYDEMIAAHLKKCVLALIPEMGSRASMGRAVLAARTLCTGDVVTAQLPVLQRELTNACNLLQDISEGKGPSPGVASKFGNFSLQFLKKIENFASWNTTSVEFQLETGPVTVTLWGQEAVKSCYDACVVTPGVVSPKDLKFMRMFRWCLQEAEASQVEAWEGESVRHAKERIASERLKAIKDAEEDADAVSKAKKVPAMDQLVLAPPLAAKKSRKNKESAAPQQQEPEPSLFEEEEPGVGNNGLMSFFGARAL